MSEKTSESCKISGCKENTIDEGFCIFHHPTYWQSNPALLEQEFQTKIQNAIENNQDVSCPGYNIPNYSVENFTFNISLRFHDAKIRGKLFFKNITFNKAVIFRDSNFFQDAVFRECIFNSSAGFGGIHFFEKIDFFQCEFFGRTNYNYTNFHNDASFGMSTFHKGIIITFIETIFEQFADFDMCFFLSVLHFSDSKFLGASCFELSTFNLVLFDGCIFQNTNFNYTTFFGRGDFSYSEFRGWGDFKGMELLSDFPLMGFEMKYDLSFAGSYFENQKRIIFEDIDLQKVSFLDSDISRIRFNNIKNSSLKEFIIYDDFIYQINKNRRYRKNYIINKLLELNKCINNSENIKKIIMNKYYLYEEDDEGLIIQKYNDIKTEVTEYINKDINLIEREMMEKIDEKPELEKIITNYRNLRDNYDYYLKYDESGNLYIREMDLIRNSKSNIEHFILSIYRFISLYGQDYRRPIKMSLIMIWAVSIMPVLRLFFSSDQIGYALYFGQLLPLMLSQFLSILSVFFQINPEINNQNIVVRLISLLLLGNVYISLKRKLERQIRH